MLKEMLGDHLFGIKKVAVVAVFGLLLSGCSATPSGSDKIIAMPQEPQISWSHKLKSDSSDLVSIYEWQAKSAVLVATQSSEEPVEDMLLELVDLETGSLLESVRLSRLSNLDGNTSRFINEIFFNAVETTNGDLLIAFSSERDSVYSSQVLKIRETGFDAIDERSTDNGVFRLLDSIEFGETLVFNYDESLEATVVYDSNFEQIRAIENGENDSVASLYNLGFVFENRESDREVTFRFEPVAQSDAREFTLPVNGTSYIEYVDQLGDISVLAEKTEDEWELITVSESGEILSTLSFTPPPGLFSPKEFVTVKDDMIYQLTEFREDFFATVLDSSLAEIEQIPIDRVEDVRWVYSRGLQNLDTLIIFDGDSRFAFLDTRSNEISRFTSVSKSRLYNFGLGFSEESFFLVDDRELLNFDLELSLNWSFDILEGESVIRAGQNLFLHRAGDEELSRLLSE